MVTNLGRLVARISKGIVEGGLAPLSSVTEGPVQGSTILGRLVARINVGFLRVGSSTFSRRLEGSGKDCQIPGRLDARTAGTLGGEASLITLTRLVARTSRIGGGICSGSDFESSTAGGVSFTTDEGVDGRGNNSSRGSVHGVNSVHNAVDIGEIPRSSIATPFPCDGFSTVGDADPRGSDLTTWSSIIGGGGVTSGSVRRARSRSSFKFGEKTQL